MDDKDVQQRIALYLEASEKMKQDGALDSEKHAKNLATQKKLFQQVVTELGLSAEEQSELEQMGEKFVQLAQAFDMRRLVSPEPDLQIAARQLYRQRGSPGPGTQHGDGPVHYCASGAASAASPCFACCRCRCFW